MKELRVFDGGAHPGLTAEVCEHLQIAKGQSELITFANGEFSTLIQESVRGRDVFLFQTSVDPIHDNLMSTLIMIDALKRAAAKRVTAVLPHFPYARQDQKTRGREPITAKLVANMISTAGADGCVMMDLHTGAIQGFFDLPTDHLTALPLFADYFELKDLKPLTVVSPDAGGVRRARYLAQRLHADLAILDKRREKPNEAKTVNVIGDVKGRSVILFDDMIDTGGTICEGVEILRRCGAREIYICATHAVFSSPATERLEAVGAKEIVVSNTIPLKRDQRLENLTVLSVAKLLSMAILRIHENRSVSELFV